MTNGVVVLSPPRSGSSCLTACISFQGFDLGKNPTSRQDTFNLKGYFENQAVLAFNEKVLSSVGAHIFRTTPLTAPQVESSVRYKSELRALLKQQLSDRQFVLKDPRIALLWELYYSELPSVKIVALRRDKKAAANSMFHMTKSLSCETVVPSVGEQICDNYFQMVDRICQDVPSLTVHFEKLMSQPATVMSRLCDFLEVPLTKEGMSLAEDFIDSNLVRY